MGKWSKKNQTGFVDCTTKYYMYDCRKPALGIYVALYFAPLIGGYYLLRAVCIESGIGDVVLTETG